MCLIFDCETGALPDEQLRTLYKEPTFEEFSATCDQRWKDDTKKEKFEAAKSTGWQKFVDGAALSPITGRILAIGFRVAESGKFGIDDGKGDEANLLANFWKKYQQCRATAGGPRKLAGWNIHGFDLPFIIRRSWLHDVTVPSTVMDAGGKYFDSMLVDLMVRFGVGAWKEFVKLDTAARFFGMNGKNGSGADFARLWFGTAEEKKQAIDYLVHDLEMTAGISQRMGVL